METLQELQDEYKREGVGVVLRELLAKIVWATVRQYPSAEYSCYGTWDAAACEDILSGWITERLWGRADLQMMLMSASSVAQIRASLTTSLRQYLTNQRRRSIASNLYKRVRSLLHDDRRFRSVGSPSAASEQRWTVADDPFAEPSKLSFSDLVDIACELTDEELQVVRYGPFSQKLSPILRDPKLVDFLTHMLTRSEGSLTVNSILDVMRFRFSLPNEEIVEVDATIASLKPGPATEAERNIAARAIVSRMTLEETEILAAYFRSHGDFAEAARQQPSSADRLRKVVRDIFGAICECSGTEDDARSIMNRVESLLLPKGES